MTSEQVRPVWAADSATKMVGPPVRPRLPQPASAESATAAVPSVTGDDGSELSGADYVVVQDLRDRVSTRLTVEDNNFAPAARRELTKKLIRDEYEQWLLHQASRGRAALADAVEDQIFAAVLAELDGLGRVAPLLSRGDVEDIHFEGSDPTMLRLSSGNFLPGSALAGSDEELVQLLRSIGSRAGDGQTSREFSAANPILNVRLRGVTDLGARLQAAMDVLPRPSGVIRVHRYSDPSLEYLREDRNMIDTPLQAFLQHAVKAGASLLVSGAPSVGKTTFLRALGNTIDYNNVVITVEDERELGLHLPRWDSRQHRMVKRHAVCRPFESRLPNAEGMGGFDMGDALHEALRASPTWVIVGEVRGAYVIYLLDAATSGVASVMCTIHSPSAEGIFDKVLINALKATPSPAPELVMRSLAALDLVVHIRRDNNYERYVSGVYELGPVGDSGKPSMTPIFASRRADARAVAQGSGAFSNALRKRFDAVGDFDADFWLDPRRSDWQDVTNRTERAS